MNKRTRKTAFVWITVLCLTFSTVGIASAGSVNDIKGHWAEGTITSWSDRNLVAGFGDGTFRPDDKVSRQEFTALVNRSFNLMGPHTTQFTDVKQTDWSYEDISIAKRVGYIAGYPDGTFKPKNEISRQEVAAIVANLLGLQHSDTVESYLDAKDTPAWSKGAISAVIDNKIMVGYPVGTFGALRSTTRAEAITILDEALRVKADRDNSTPTTPTTPITPEPTTPAPTTPGSTTPTSPGPTTPTPTTSVPSQPMLGNVTVAPGSDFTINAPSDGITAWLAPVATTTFTAGTNMTNLIGNGMANKIVVPMTEGYYKLFLVNAVGVSLASEGTLTVTTEIKPVELGIAGDFAILAKTGISTVPESIITGNIGVSPIAATSITGFSLTMDATNTFSTSTQVTGAVYASDYSLSSSSYLTVAINDMVNAYNDASGRAVKFTELHAGDVGGKTLTAGFYKWGTDVLINSDVTLDGGANDIFIFQVDKGIIQANGTKIILTGGAQAKNIFWQAAETVSIGTDAHFEGNILGMTNISLGTKASINGRLLAQTAVTMDQNTVTAP